MASFPASNRRQFYVSVSRGKKQATIYTNDKDELLAAVRKSDERLSATELLDDSIPLRARDDRSHELSVDQFALTRPADLRPRDVLYDR